MDLFILKTDVEKFTSTYEKTLHMIFKKVSTVGGECVGINHIVLLCCYVCVKICRVFHSMQKLSLSSSSAGDSQYELLHWLIGQLTYDHFVKHFVYFCCQFTSAVATLTADP